MLRVALTGGIATGKSYVAAAPARRPACRSWMPTSWPARSWRRGTPGLRAIAERFGPGGARRRTAALDRPALAAIVFSDSAARRDLEAIVHPAVRAAIDAFFAAVPPATPFAVADIPLLFETGRDRRVRRGRGRGLPAARCSSRA